MRKIAWLGFATLSAAGSSACSAPTPEASDYGATRTELVSSTLPSFAQAFEVIPSVVPDDGTTPFRVRYDTNRAVTSVRLTNPFQFAPGSDLNLYDDGTHGDEVAGDFVFTSAPLSLVQ